MIAEPETIVRELLDAKSVAILLDCSPRHVVRLADSGRLPRPLKVGRLTRWRREDISDWVLGGCPSIGRGTSR